MRAAEFRLVWLYASLGYQLAEHCRQYRVGNRDGFAGCTSPAKFAAKVSPLEAVTGSARQNTTFRHAANTHRWKVDVALGIHHAKAKRRSYLLMTCAFATCLTLFLGFCTLVPFMKNAFMPKGMGF